METNSDSWWPDVLSIGKTQNVLEMIVYNLSQQKRFFADVTLKSSMAHYRLICDIFVFKMASQQLSGGTKSFRLLQFSWAEKGHLCKKINDVTQTI